jgi:ubiquinone biosynthesis protein
MVAGRDSGHALADRLDHSGALMAEDRRPRVRVDPIDDVEVGVANAARGHANGDLPSARRIDVDVLYPKRLAGFVQDRGPHGLTVSRPAETPGPGPSVSPMKRRDQVRLFHAAPGGAYHCHMASMSERRQTVGRLREIAQVATRHGFGFVFERRALRRAAVIDDQNLPALGRHLREMLDELGPSFVKFGQLLSTRPDIVPGEILVELRQLQDAVRPFPYADVERMIEEDLRAPLAKLFTEFDPVPVAAASIGQVHLAELPSRRHVAVKVQRPGAARQIERDLAVLYQVARIVKRRVDRLDFIDPVAVVDEFARSIRRELDYRIEARTAEIFRQNFASDARVLIPKVYGTYSSGRVLTLERLEGIQLADLDLVTTPMDERRRLAILIAETWLEMIFRHGHFHGDPHPANIFVLEDGRLGLVDFGMTGSLSDGDMRRLTRLLLDAVNENVDALPRRLYELGVRFNREQEEELRIELREVYYRYYGASMGQIDPLQVIREAFVLVSRMHLRLPTRFALLDKALATLGGVGTEIYPDFNVFEVAEPYAAELVQRRYSPRRLAERGWEEVESYGGLLMELPYQVHDTLEQLRDGEVEVQFRHRGLDLLTRQADVVMNRLVIAVVMAATIVGSSLIGISAQGGWHLFGIHVLALAGFIVASGLGFVLVASIVRSGRL